MVRNSSQWPHGEWGGGANKVKVRGRNKPGPVLPGPPPWLITSHQIWRRPSWPAEMTSHHLCPSDLKITIWIKTLKQSLKALPLGNKQSPPPFSPCHGTQGQLQAKHRPEKTFIIVHLSLSHRKQLKYKQYRQSDMTYKTTRVQVKGRKPYKLVKCTSIPKKPLLKHLLVCKWIVVQW